MQKVNLKTTKLNKDYFINGKPLFSEMSKKDLNMLVMDLEAEISAYYSMLKQNTPIKIPP